jgi:hypothetical protein
MTTKQNEYPKKNHSKNKLSLFLISNHFHFFIWKTWNVTCVVHLHNTNKIHRNHKTNLEKGHKSLIISPKISLKKGTRPPKGTNLTLHKYNFTNKKILSQFFGSLFRERTYPPPYSRFHFPPKVLFSFLYSKQLHLCMEHSTTQHRSIVG